MVPTLNDALALIQRAENSINPSKQEPAYIEQLEGLIGRFKGQLALDHDLPMDFFTPVNFTDDIPEIIDQVPVELNSEVQENPELSDKARELYEQIEMAI
jgi:hypothetical protein